MRRIKLFVKHLQCKFAGTKLGSLGSKLGTLPKAERAAIAIALAAVSLTVVTSLAKPTFASSKGTEPVLATLPADYVPETEAPYLGFMTEMTRESASVTEKTYEPECDTIATDNTSAETEQETESVPEVPEISILEDDVPATNEVSFAFEKMVVKYVVDGDTIIAFNPDTSSEYKIRMILVDTPESVASEDYQKASGKSNSIYGQMASDYTKSKLTQGMEVYVTNDSVLIDKYERRLCYVWKELPFDIDSEQEIREKCYNAELLSQGYATILKIDNDKYYSLFCRLEKEAIDDRRGLWADTAYREAMGVE